MYVDFAASVLLNPGDGTENVTQSPTLRTLTGKSADDGGTWSYVGGDHKLQWSVEGRQLMWFKCQGRLAGELLIWDLNEKPRKASQGRE